MQLRVVLIILYDSAKNLLLQHRSHDARIMPDYWAFFGGEIKEGETPEQAVRREAFEELNYLLKSPELVLEQEFKEAGFDGHMHVYSEAFDGDKSGLRLQEGQGWGWFTETKTQSLKMIGRDRKIINFIVRYLEKTGS